MIAAGRPPPQVVSYSARAAHHGSAPGRMGQPYVFASVAPEVGTGGRSPARLRPAVHQVISTNHSPARTRMGPLGTAQPVVTGHQPASASGAPPHEAHGAPTRHSAPTRPATSSAYYPTAPSAHSRAGVSVTAAAAPDGPVAIRPRTESAGYPGSAALPPGAGSPCEVAGGNCYGGIAGHALAEEQHAGPGSATLLCPWPLATELGAVQDEDPEPTPQRAKGNLTAEEKIPYNDLQFIEHLGSGEFGQVFRGKYQGIEVAVKQLYWDNSVLPEMIIQDLTREIESFRHLEHKRLVGFIGACLEIPNLCLVTEYMPGGSLHHLLHVRKLRLPLLHCTNMCLQLADGVMYLHSHEPVVVHRDLKSLNVVLDMNLNLKLCDFGLTESMERTHITKKNNGGSPRYMAPELFDSKSKITEKVDIWSMGCIFTEINGGPLPYEGINTLADLTKEMLVHRRMPAIPQHIPDVVQDIIRSCYNFDSRLRPSARTAFEQLKDAKRRLRSQGVLGS